MKSLKRYIVNIGNKPFDYTLKELDEFNSADYLCKRVIIEYWKCIDIDKEDCNEMDDFCIFEGEISCISSKGQLRLQYIDILSPKSVELRDKYLPNPFHHSYWFSFKLIGKIYLILNDNKHQDITNKILNIIKFKIAQSFLFYSPISQFGKENISKFVDQNYKYNIKSLNNDSNDMIDMEELKFFIKYKLKYLVNNPSTKFYSLTDDVESFLYDLNRSNRHILFIERESLSRNKQRQIMKLNTKTLMSIVTNYIFLWNDWIKGIESNAFQKRRKKYIKQKVNERKETDEWDDYINWDNTEISVNADEFDRKYVNLETSMDELFNVTPFDESNWLSRLVNQRRISGKKKRSKGNKKKSQRADAYWKYVHSREYLNNQIYVNTKEVATFNRYSRRNDKKRWKYKKYMRKIQRLKIHKETRKDWDIWKKDELVLERIERAGNRGKMIVYDEEYIEIVIIGFLRQFVTNMLSTLGIVQVIHKYMSIS